MAIWGLNGLLIPSTRYRFQTPPLDAQGNCHKQATAKTKSYDSVPYGPQPTKTGYQLQRQAMLFRQTENVYVCLCLAWRRVFTTPFPPFPRAKKRRKKMGRRSSRTKPARAGPHPPFFFGECLVNKCTRFLPGIPRNHPIPTCIRVSCRPSTKKVIYIYIYIYPMPCFSWYDLSTLY